ncbi:chitooligosaccharide deacetylase NodB [Rhizobium grahamii]|uniref:Chitooligosaccharide deacetylase n=1 Tax=Rhizobium grahamii CCGE 502 TaxID=990285 RepID=S3I1Q8_9HYPH|nr:chitooligosaccharide deacetylase NodB [Rhizobium grahamii]EPE93733.1 polysaccharide deacetylase, NodB [Rhizobium grahamii CCGE 502]
MTPLDCLYEISRPCADRAAAPTVYLTFDDGPHPLCTPQILDILSEYQAPAAFFAIGVYAKAQKQILQRMIAEGHQIANHTMTHPDLSQCSASELEDEIFTTGSTISAVCPQACLRYMRAPYGIWTQEVLKTCQRAGLVSIHWSVDPRDWDCPGVDAIVTAVLEGVRPGAVILLHDGCPPNELNAASGACIRSQTIAALAHLIPALRTRGYSISPLPQNY